MHQVILVEKNLTIDTMISLNLNVYADCDVISKKGHLEAIEHIKQNENISLIISRKEINEEKTALEIYRHISSEEKQIPLIVLGEEPLLESHAKLFPDKFEMADLIKAAANVLGVSAQEMAQKIVPDYYPIPIEFFISTESLICHTFIKMVTESATNYIPRFQPGETITMSIIEELIKKGVTTLYIPKEQRLKFTHDLTNRLIQQLSNEQIETDEQIQLTSNSIELVREQLQSAGFSEETAALADKSIQSVITLVQRMPVLKDLLRSLLNSKTSYRYRCAQLSTYIAFHILKNVEWGSTEQEGKLAFVAIFHDITLEKDAWAMIRSDDSLKKACLGDRDLSNVQNHALEAAKIVQNYSKTPLGAETIIRQHHGSNVGAGYAKTFSNNLAPLTMVFTIAEEYAHLVLTLPKERIKKEIIIKHLENRFTKSNYLKLIKTLANINPDIFS